MTAEDMDLNGLNLAREIVAALHMRRGAGVTGMYVIAGDEDSSDAVQNAYAMIMAVSGGRPWDGPVSTSSAEHAPWKGSAGFRHSRRGRMAKGIA